MTTCHFKLKLLIKHTHLMIIFIGLLIISTIEGIDHNSVDTSLVSAIDMKMIRERDDDINNNVKQSLTLANKNNNNDINVHRKEIVVSDFELLSIFYNSTNGPSWTNNLNWMSGEPCTSSWYGLYCVSGSVIQMSLTSNSLGGTLPSELGLLTRLTHFNMYFNSIYGNIPSEYGQWTNNYNMFGLYRNSFSGSIPSELGRMSMMVKDFILGTNELTGVLPSQLGQLTGITSYFYLLTNNLCGEIPVEVAAMNSANGGKVAYQYNIESGNSFGTLCCSVNPKPNITCAPSLSPTVSFNPTQETQPPTLSPTLYPTLHPTLSPTLSPTPVPTPTPTTMCSAGKRYDGFDCIDCSIGRYTNFSSAPYPANCSLCPSGQYNTETALSSCTSCADGKVSSSDRTFCKDCSGKYHRAPMPLLYLFYSINQ